MYERFVGLEARKEEVYMPIAALTGYHPTFEGAAVVVCRCAVSRIKHHAALSFSAMIWQAGRQPAHSLLQHVGMLALQLPVAQVRPTQSAHTALFELHATCVCHRIHTLSLSFAPVFAPQEWLMLLAHCNRRGFNTVMSFYSSCTAVSPFP